MKKFLLLPFLLIFSISLFSQNGNSFVKREIKPVSFSIDKNAKSPFADTLFLDTLTFYLDSVYPGLWLWDDSAGGYVTGTNSRGDIGKMQKYETNYDCVITELLYFFGRAKGTGNFRATIWDDNSGQPGNRIGIVTVPMSAIDTNYSNFTSIIFPTSVPIPANHIFWAGIEFENNSPGDTIALVSTGLESWFHDAMTYTFEERSDSTYHSIADTSGWGLNLAYVILPVVTYDSTQFNIIRGNLFLDSNLDGVRDSLEQGISNKVVKAGVFYGITDFDGNYVILTDTGTFYIKPVLPPYYISDSTYVNFSSLGNSSINNNLPCHILPGIRDLSVSLISIGFAPGFISGYFITYANEGTQAESGTVELNYDSQLNYQYTMPAPDSVNGNALYWNFSNLVPGESRLIEAIFETPDTLPIGTNLLSSSYIVPVINDTIPINNYDTLAEVVTGSIDPNEKIVSPKGSGTQGYIGLDPIQLEYTIHFQNTGTDTAFTIVVRDTLSDNLDVSTFKILGSGHPCNVSLVGSKVLNFTFNNILLPDSNINQLGSNGFVKYAISLKHGLAVETEIQNKAYIYFDYNAPVITNTTLNTVGLLTNISEIATISDVSKIFPNPMNISATININTENKIENATLQIYDVLGNLVFSKSKINSNQIFIHRGDLKQGIYFYKISNDKKIFASGKFIIENK